MIDLKEENMFESKDISCVGVNEDSTKIYYSETNEIFEYNVQEKSKNKLIEVSEKIQTFRFLQKSKKIILKTDSKLILMDLSKKE